MSPYVFPPAETDSEGTGIDVQAELRLKTTGGGRVKPNPMLSKPPTLERAAVSRGSVQRHQAGIAPKEPFGMPQHRDGSYGIPSPQFQPTPSSHVSSPSHSKSPGFAIQGAMSPVDSHAPTRPHILPQPRNIGQASPPVGMRQSESSDPKSNMPGTGSRAPRVPSAYYPSPFQKHYDQLGMSLSYSRLSYLLTSSRARVRCSSRPSGRGT